MARIFEPAQPKKIFNDKIMANAMHSEWKVTSNYIGDDKVYAVYRLRNINEVDHSGNREYAGGWVSDREAAVEIAAELNKK